MYLTLDMGDFWVEREDFGIGLADGYKRSCLLEGRIRQSLLSRGLLLSAVRKQIPMSYSS